MAGIAGGNVVAMLPETLRPVDVGPLVRLGAAGDGGYVLPQRCLDETDTLLSFGISANWEFEKAFRRAVSSEQRALTIHAYDHTVSRRSLWLYRVKSLVHLAMSREPRYWAAFRQAAGYARFFDGRQATHFKEMVTWREGPGQASIDKIISRVGDTRRIFLSMDIEGHEYRVAGQLEAHFPRFVGMAIEFHELDILRDRFFRIHESLLSEFVVCHIHANNVAGAGPDGFPNTLEMTYLHRRFAPREATFSSNTYPLPGLDTPNSLVRSDFILDFSGPA